MLLKDRLEQVLTLVNGSCVLWPTTNGLEALGIMVEHSNVPLCNRLRSLPGRCASSLEWRGALLNVRRFGVGGLLDFISAKVAELADAPDLGSGG